jgi:hypothetical protein
LTNREIHQTLAKQHPTTLGKVALTLGKVPTTLGKVALTLGKVPTTLGKVALTLGKDFLPMSPVLF